VSLARFIAAALAAAALTSAPLSAASQDAAQGRLKAQPCSVCHGPLGISMVPDAPHLAGQPAIYLAAQLRLYRSGERKHEVMSVMARSLSDDDIAHLAAWFASIRVEAKPPG
jgi:cytochrome c553